MSDENSRNGYDDVLSSVRRIVASEVEAVRAQSDADKLLLTPSLRVAEPQDRETTQPSLDDRDFPTLAERIADLEASVGSEAADWEPDGSEDQAQHAPDAVVLPLNPAARRGGDARAGAKETAEADLVFAVPGESHEDDEAKERSDASGTAAPEKPKLAPPAANDPGPAFTTFRHRDKHDAPPPSVPAEDDEPAILDEVALRDLVAEIVREELQGGLGERITRNVRKLVRAEIQRAFAARDLD